MRWFLGAFWLVALGWVLPLPARACKCVVPPAPAEALHAATAVFEGRVTSITEAPARAGQPATQWLVRVHTTRAWKGVETEDVSVLTPKDTAACGFTFMPDESYLVYASGSLAELSVNACSRTQLSSAADADIGALGMGVVPVNPNVPDAGPRPTHASEVVRPATAPGEGGCASCTMGHQRSHGSEPWAGLLVPLALASLRLRRQRVRVRRPPRPCGDAS